MINIFVCILKHDVEERRNTVAVEIETFLMPTSPPPPFIPLVTREMFDTPPLNLNRKHS